MILIIFVSRKVNNISILTFLSLVFFPVWATNIINILFSEPPVSEWCSGYRQYDREWKVRGRKIFFSSQNLPVRFWGPPSLICIAYWVSVSGVKCPDREVGNPVPYSVHLYFYSNAGLHGLHKENFTFTFNFTSVNLQFLFVRCVCPLLEKW